MDNDEKTLFSAMRSFHSIAQAVVFTSNEIALFHALLYTWNAARRPAVIEQWADTTSRNAGMTPKVLRDSRNKLVQKGVIFYEKPSNREVPRYSFNALFDNPSPFLPSEKDSNPDSNPDSKRSVSGTVNGHSYQGEEKRKKRTSPQAPEGPKKWEPDKIQIRLNRLFNRRDTTRWSEKELKAYRKLEIVEEDLQLIEKYSDPNTGAEFRRKDLGTLLNNWTGELDRARNWSPLPAKKPQSELGY